MLHKRTRVMRRWPKLITALVIGLAVPMGHAADFEVQAGGNVLLRIESDGDVVLPFGWIVDEARLHQWTRELRQRGDVSEFVIQRQDGTVLALIDAKRGNLYIYDFHLALVANIASGPREFLIKTGSLLRFRLTTEGILYFRGTETEGTCADERQDLVDQYDDLSYNYFDVHFGAVECYKLVDNNSYVDPGDFPYNKLKCSHTDEEGQPLSRAHTPWEWDETVAHMFQAVHDKYGADIDVTSGFRCPLKNDSIPNANNESKHAYGRAFDYQQMVGGLPSTQKNWDVALKANAAELDPNRIRLYDLGGSPSMTLQQFYTGGWDADNLPHSLPGNSPDWTGISRGHCDSGQPAYEGR